MELPVVHSEVEPSSIPVAGDAPRSRLYDSMGVVASCACAVHCAAMPFAIGSLPALGLTWLADEGFHQWMVGICFVIAVVAVLPGYRRHRRLVVPLLAMTGVSLLATAAFAVPDECCRLDLAELTETNQAVSLPAAEHGSSESQTESLPPCCEHGDDDEEVKPVINLKNANLLTETPSVDASVDPHCTKECCEQDEAQVSNVKAVLASDQSTDNSTYEVRQVNTTVSSTSISANEPASASVWPDWLSSSLLTTLGGCLLVAAHLMNRCCRDCRE